MSQNASVVATRFAPPRIGRRAIRRDRLLARLHDARECRLALITAGAGFGKSTLVALWRQELLCAGARVVWMSLTADDGSLGQFCAALHGALRQAGVPVQDDVLLLSESDRDPKLAARALLDVLPGAPGDLYLLIDDFHHVDDPRTLQLVQTLLDAAFPGLRLVITSRSRSPLLLGRLRATGDLCEIHDAELAFELPEALSFLQANLDPTITPEVAAQIHAVSDGWPIGMQLIAIALKSDPLRWERLRVLRPSSEDLAAYLSEDVIGDLPPEMVEFMQRVSILRRFDGDLAAHVTGFPDAEELISEIRSRNLFLQPVEADGRQRWYRFHPLFSEFLGQGLTRSGISVMQLHRRAADWFAREGLLAEAMRHALLGDDFDAVIRLLEDDPAPLETVSELSTMVRWIEHLPAGVLARHPKLLFLGGWASVLTARTERAEMWAAMLESEVAGEVDIPELRLLEAMIASQRDDPLRADALMAGLRRGPLGNPQLEPLRIAMLVWVHVTAGDHAGARSVYRSSSARATRTGTGELALLAAATAALGILREGRVFEAHGLVEVALETAQRHHGRNSMSACLCAAVSAACLYELGRIDDARERLTNRLGMLRHSAPEMVLQVALTQGRLHWLRESRNDALDHLLHEEAHFRSLRFDRGVAHMLAEQQRLALEEGDLRHAAALQAAIDGLARGRSQADMRDAEIQAVAALACTRLALARHDPTQALRSVRTVQAMAARLGRQSLQVTADLLQAQALDDLGRMPDADACIRAALATGRRLGLVRTLLDEGERIPGMLLRVEADDRTGRDDYLQRLIPDSAMDERERGAAPAILAQTLAGRHGTLPLTPRELEIVALLDQSMSNKRIALALNISEQTVKWNLKSIFGKLGVGSRYQATVVARELGLPPGVRGRGKLPSDPPDRPRARR